MGALHNMHSLEISILITFINEIIINKTNVANLFLILATIIDFTP